MKSQSAGKPHLLIPIGIPGSGKSHFAKHFAKTFNAPLVSSENIGKKLFSNFLLSDTQKITTENITLYLLDEILKTGRTVIYDGQTSTKSNRIIIKKKARSFGYEPIFIWVQTDIVTAKKRLKKLFKKDSGVVESDINKFERPLSTEKYIVISGKHTFSSQLKIILKYLAGPTTSTDNRTLTRKPLISSR